MNSPTMGKRLDFHVDVLSDQAGYIIMIIIPVPDKSETVTWFLSGWSGITQIKVCVAGREKGRIS